LFQGDNPGNGKSARTTDTGKQKQTPTTANIDSSPKTIEDLPDPILAINFDFV
jgi:hypothetical protein